MRFFWGILLFTFLLTSCNYFETEKIDAQTLFEQEMATINWKEVDTYPLFRTCDETEPKEQQLICFHGQVSKTIAGVINDSIQGVMSRINDTVYMKMKIDTAGLFSLNELTMDSITARHIPNFESWLNAALANMEKVAPATKKGVPVATQYTLPLVLSTD